jgi:hypothetical protein
MAHYVARSPGRVVRALSFSSVAAAALLVLAVGCTLAFVRGAARKRSKVVLALVMGCGVAWIGFLVLFFAMAAEL